MNVFPPLLYKTGDGLHEVNGVSLKNKTYSSDYYNGEFTDHYAPGHITAVARKLRKEST